MHIIMRSRNCDVSEKVKTQAREKVEHATRIYDRLNGLEVSFSEEQNPRISDPAKVEITARTKKHTVRAVGAGTDHHEAVDKAVDKLERQLRRYKTKLVDSRRHAEATSKVAPIVTETSNQPEAVNEEPTIVKRKKFDLAPMYEDDAILQLEMLGHDFFLFINEGSQLPSVVYRREDGDIGLIEGGLSSTLSG